MKKTKLYTTIGIVTAFSFVISTVSVLANDINQTGSEYTQSQNIEDNAFSMRGFPGDRNGMQPAFGQANYSINITGGTVSVSSSGDGLDSNGNINLTGGTITIKSASDGGEAGIDFDGSYFISENVVLNNASGVSGPDMMPGQTGGQMGEPGQMNSQMGQPGQMNGQIGQPGNPPGRMPGGQGGTHGGLGGSSTSVTYSAKETISSDTTESDKTISSDTSDVSAVIVEGSTVTENNLTVSKTGSSDGGDNCNFYGQNAAVLAKDGAILYINDSYIYSDADGANGVFSYGGNGGKNGASGDADSGTSLFSMTGGSLTSLNGEVFHVTNTNAVTDLTNVSITNKDSDNVLLTVTNDGWSGADNIAVFNADSQKFEGSIIVSNTTVKDDNSSKLTLNLTNSSVFEGNINTSESDKGIVNVRIDASSTWKLTADSYVTSVTGSGCIDYNGYILYVDGTAYTAENPMDGFKAAGTADYSETQELASVVFKNTSKTVKAAVLESSKKSYSVIKTSGGGTVSAVKYYKNAADYIKVSSTGKITVKKGTPAGTYRIKIKVAASDGYSEAVKVIKVKVK